MGSQFGIDWEYSLSSEKRKTFAKEFVPSIEYYRKSLALSEKINDKKDVLYAMLMLGKMYNYAGEFELAKSYLKKNLEAELTLRNNYDINIAYYELGKTHINLNNYSQSIYYLNKSLELSEKNKSQQITKDVYLALSFAYKASGDCYKSMGAYQKFVQVQDSVLNVDNMKQIEELQTQYETEKKKQQIVLLNKDAKLKDVEISQKNTAIYFFIVGLLLVLAITFLLFRQNNERKKANIVITHQKKEITDSIQYASRIQRAVIPPEEHLKQFFSDSFVYFRPRDIVSGDFYWVSARNNKIIVAAADCTGHGVPGAFMSMLGMSILNNIVAEKGFIHSNEILDELRLQIITSLHQTGKEGENKDGMDIALYIFDKDTMFIEYAGANNPIYLVRKGELLETKADKMPIGIHDKCEIPFKSTIIPVELGDMVYTFSDGFQDQFGGPDNKKFMSGNAKKLYMRVHAEPAENQSAIIQQTIADWMKNTEQIDDQLIIGVRV